jgi:beta-glucanase (GH16 family)
MNPVISLLLTIALLSTPLARAENVLPSPTSESPTRPVVNLSISGAEQLGVPSPATHVTVTRAAGGSGLDIAVAPGPASFPGVSFMSPDIVYDLTGTGYVEASITNTGSQIISVSMRVDNGAGVASATGSAYLKPGESGKTRAYYASPAKGSAPVDPASISKVLFFIGKNEKAARSFRLESLVAGGNPGDRAPTNPDLVRTKPGKNGVLFGSGLPFDADKQLVARSGASAGASADKTVAVTFSSQSGQNILLRPVRGFWDLGDFLQVTVRVKNTGSAPAALTAQLTSRGGVSDFGILEKPVAPGATADLVIPFIPKAPFEIIADPAQEILEGKKSWGMKEAPGSRFTSHQTTGVLLTPAGDAAPSSFQVVSITAGMPPHEPAPSWLGQRPPAAGDWVKTFEDNFDGAVLNTDAWNVQAENYWDKRVGFSKNNVLLGGGFARLRIEKRDGHHNDDPNGRSTTFATGWLDSYGKWTQRYGYYEVRVKMPTAPSMFPAFWLMPERGPSDWPKHRRTDTKDGGMEFDVFEGQSMWGPYRTTFGMHWDSYVKYHKSAGTSFHYNRPDKDGFLTIGMLWTPGHVSVYSQGRKGGSWDSPRVGSVQSYLIFDLLPGGFEYEPLDPATLPADLVIDYVRVWQRKDLASPDDGPKSPATP